jgi:hypothetical protein
MSKYDLTAIAIEELRAFGIEPTQIRRSGSGHYKYSFVNDTERFIVVAATPSDCRAQDNNRAVMRRIICQATELL